MFTDVHRSLERNEFNRDEEFKMVEMIKLLRQGQRPDLLSFSHSYISHVIASPVVCLELPADDSTSINLLCSRFRLCFPAAQKHVYQADVRLGQTSARCIQSVFLPLNPFTVGRTPSAHPCSVKSSQICSFINTDNK